MQGSWRVVAMEGAEVRLRNGQTGLGDLEVTAPLTAGLLVVDAAAVSLSMTLALDRLRTPNFLMQMAARSLITRHGAHLLEYAGTGPAGQPWAVEGPAVSGDVRMEISLTITPIGTGSSLSEIELVGTHRLGEVQLPIPGFGKVDDFAFHLDARLRVQAA